VAARSPASTAPRPRSRARTAKHHVDWAVHARSTVMDARRYTRFVTIMKRALLLAAAALLIAVLAYSLQPRDTSRFAMTTFAQLGKIANDLSMVKPHLVGADSDGNPFVVTADLAIQDPHNVHRARLFNVEADTTTKDHAWINARSPRGFLDSDANKLWLSENVSLFTDSGYEVHTKAAFIDMAPACLPSGAPPSRPRPGKPPPRCATTSVRGDVPVNGQGPLGTFRADRFRIEKGSKHIYLLGHVRMTLYPDKMAPASKSGKPAKPATKTTKTMKT
jgi:lipopolysaccharide export system protein LptC